MQHMIQDFLSHSMDTAALVCQGIRAVLSRQREWKWILKVKTL